MKEASKDKQIIPVIDKKKKELSKLENLFNYRIKRVKRLKDNINLASTQVQSFRQEMMSKVIPATNKINERQVVLIKELVTIFDEKILKGKKQNEKFKALILFLIEDLIFEKEQEGLDELYERFAEKTIEETEAEAVKEEKEKLLRVMDMFGFEITEEEKEKLLSDEEDEEFMEEFEKKFSSENLENAKNSFFGDFGFGERKKSQKQLEKEEKRNKELENISKTVKQVYKELMKELHPDKEPDEIKQLEKTQLVQEITEAYRNDDLFTLLSIQLAQLDETDNTKLSEEKINYFNTMLLNQARELEEQKESLGHEANLPTILIKTLGKKEFDNLSKRVIKENQQEIKEVIKNVNSQIEKIQAKDKKYLKMFVEENYENLIEPSPFDFSMMSEFFSE
ncbi:hypothetical protein ACE193_17405 [Bernardetia sp. OM2101]|uniref:hypothetical protein n=1 Tax=Bernardetia sp. OM2101 TaxID=3344876 RepID=UPI0035CECC90